jgi:hypothetical protein
VPGIRIAGNTYGPSLLALRARGYRLVLEYTKIDNKSDPFYPYKADEQAEKDGWSFSATTPLELLGLVTIWEVRGDAWHTRSEEPNIYEELSANAKVFDLDGNEIEDPDD